MTSCLARSYAYEDEDALSEFVKSSARPRHPWGRWLSHFSERLFVRLASQMSIAHRV